MIVYVLIVVGLYSWLYLYDSFERIDVFTLYLVSMLLSFVLLTIVYLIKTPPDIDVLAQFLTVVYVMGTTMILMYMVKIIFPKEYIQLTTVETIIKYSKALPTTTVIILALVTFGVIFIFFQKYQLIFRVAEYDNAGILNKYNIVMSSFVIPLLHLLLIIAIAARDKSIVTKYLYNAILVIILFYFVLYSRREILLALLVFLFIDMYNKKKNAFSLARVPLLIVALFILVIVSNIYQNIRFDLAEATSKGEPFVLKKSLFELAFDFKASEQNVKDRMSIFDFTSETISKQINDGIPVTHGVLLGQGLLNSIPSALYPGKVVKDIDTITAHHFHIRVTDYPSSIMGMFIIDYGVDTFILYPITMIFYIYFIFLLLKYNQDKPLLYLIIITYEITLFFNVEGTIGDLIISMRNILIIVFLYLFVTKFYYFIKSIKINVDV